MMFRVDQGDTDRAFRLVGELDLASAEHMLQRLEPVAGQPGDLDLDAAELTFIDSTGLHGLVTLTRKLGSHGRLIIHHAHPFVRKVVAIAGLDQQQVFILTED
jgi:anti-anti-sigma factor